jgi:hypothetical protein
MTFKARDVADGYAGEEFEWEDLGGATHRVPSAKVLTTEQVQQFAQGRFDVLSEVWPQAAYEALLRLPIHVTEQLTMAWVEASRPGKSGSPSSPTPGSGTR